MRFSLPLVPNNVINIHLFRAVSNSSQLLASLKEADPKVNFCFLDCRRICSINQILCAITRALRDAEDGAMRTKNVYSEIVYSLSPNQNITEALKRFGIATDSENIVCVAIDNASCPLAEWISLTTVGGEHISHSRQRDRIDIAQSAGTL